MAEYSELGFLMDNHKDLPPPRYEYPVEENDKGLFVIIKNDDFKYKHRLENGFIWKESVTLGAGYKKDYNLLFKTFNLKLSDSHVKAMTNIVGECENELPEKYFKNFMDEQVIGYEGKPKFVFVVLMSHGFQNGVFLLADTNQDPCCQNSGHTHKGKCHERQVKEDLIEPIQKKYREIPKIFLLQICRGSKKDDIAKRMAMGGGAELPKPKDFIPRTADTLVIYAGSEDQITWVNLLPNEPVGSPIIYEFCYAVLQLKERLSSVSQTLVNLESEVSGWIEDICRVASANVATRCMIYEKRKDHQGDLVSAEAVTKIQPEISNTMHSRLSVIEMMRTQIPNWGKPTVS